MRYKQVNIPASAISQFSSMRSYLFFKTATNRAIKLNKSNIGDIMDHTEGKLTLDSSVSASVKYTTIGAAIIITVNLSTALATILLMV